MILPGFHCAPLQLPHSLCEQEEEAKRRRRRSRRRLSGYTAGIRRHKNKRTEQQQKGEEGEGEGDILKEIKQQNRVSLFLK